MEEGFYILLDKKFEYIYVYVSAPVEHREG